MQVLPQRLLDLRADLLEVRAGAVQQNPALRQRVNRACATDWRITRSGCTPGTNDASG